MDIKKKRKVLIFTCLPMLVLVLLSSYFMGLALIKQQPVLADTNNKYTINASCTYQTPDNKKYLSKHAESWNKMSFNSSTFGKLEISGVNPEANYDNVLAYSLKGDSPVSITYTSLFSNNYINNSVWNISKDSAQRVNGISLNKSSICKGAFILEKKQIGEKNYKVEKKLNNIFENKVAVKIDSLNGDQINTGCYYRATVAYEIYRKYEVKKRFLWWNWTDTKTEYKNCLESYNFFVGKNSCKIQLLDLAEKDYSQYADDDEQKDIIKNGDTLLNNSVTVKGFKINYLGNKSYNVKYSYNNKSFVQATDGLELKQNGKYIISVKSLFGKETLTTIYVFNGGFNKGYSSYFGQNILHGKQVANLEQKLETYQVGVAVKLIGTNGFLPTLRGKITNNSTNAITIINPSINEQTFVLNTPGVYSIELVNGDTNLPGTYYTYNFAFIVSEQSAKPSINISNILTSSSIKDYSSKFIDVKYIMKSGKVAHICFNKDDYTMAYQFAFAVEKKYVTKLDDGYLYDGNKYTNNLSLVKAMNKNIDDKISYNFFTNANKSIFIDTSDLASYINVEDLNYNKDVYLTTAVEQGKMSLRQNILDANFRFVQAGTYESETITAKNLKNNKITKLSYNTKLGSMLKESGKYLITETNSYGESIQYNIIYCKEYTAQITLDVDGNEVVLSNNNYQIINGKKVSIKTIINELDADGVLTIANLNTKQISMFDNDDASYIDLENDNYLLTFMDRSGNTYNLVINCNDNEIKSISEAINIVKNENLELYKYIVKQKVSSLTNTYNSVN